MSPPLLPLPNDKWLQPRRGFSAPVRAGALFLFTALCFLVLYNFVEARWPQHIRHPLVLITLAVLPGIAWAIVILVRYTSAMRAYRLAHELRDEGKLGEAERVLKPALRHVRGPVQQLLLAECGRVILLRSEPHRALELFASAEAHRQTEGAEDVWRQLAMDIALSLALAGQKDAARQWLREARLREALPSWEAELARGLIAKMEGQGEEAARAFDSALALTLSESESALVKAARETS